MKEYSKEERKIIVDLINKMQLEIFKFKKINKREPDSQEIANIMNKPVEKIIEIKNILQELENENKKASIELKEATKFDKYVVTDELVIDNQEEFNELKEKIILNSKILNDREREVLYLRYGIENEKMFSITEISEKLNLSISFTRSCIIRALNIIYNKESSEKRRKAVSQINKYMKGN